MRAFAARWLQQSAAALKAYLRGAILVLRVKREYDCRTHDQEPTDNSSGSQRLTQEANAQDRPDHWLEIDEYPRAGG